MKGIVTFETTFWASTLHKTRQKLANLKLCLLRLREDLFKIDCPTEYRNQQVEDIDKSLRDIDVINHLLNKGRSHAEDKDKRAGSDIPRKRK